MNQREIEEKIMKLLTDMPECGECTPDMDLMDEIGLSSIEVMELITCAEEMFGIRISSRDLRMVSTPAELAELIEGKMS